MERLRSYCEVLKADAATPIKVLQEGIIYPEDFICSRAEVSEYDDSGIGYVTCNTTGNRCPIYDQFFTIVQKQREKRGIEEKL